MTASIKIKQSITLVSFIFVVLIFLLGFLYLRDVNSLATKGYEIKEKVERKELLELENQTLNIKLSELRRLERLEEFAQSQNLVKIEKVSFLSAPGELVVTKD